MRTHKLSSQIVYILVSLLISSTALSDWSPGDGYKMHSPQLPNINGWDICLVHQAIADDFKCSESGLIKDIHFWVSWRGDNEDFGDVTWNIAICANSFGQPGKVLWTLKPAGARIAYKQYGTHQQGWFCPSTGQNVPGDHTQFYQVNVTKITEPFWQTKGQVYWLGIQADMDTTTAEVGWKSSSSQYFGQAVYKSKLGDWLPIGVTTHDLAFVITGGPPTEVDVLNMAHIVELITPIGKEFFAVTGPLTWKVFFEGPQEGDATDDDGDGRDEVELEVANLDWSGTSSLYGPVTVREHPTLKLTGVMEELVNNTPGTLDVPPFTVTGTADVIIDLYFEIEFNGQKFYTDQTSKIRAVITHKPPGPMQWFCFHEHRPMLNASGTTTNSYFALGPHSTGPTIEVDPFEFSRAQIQILKSGVIATVDLTGFSSMYTYFDGPEEGPAYDNDKDGHEEVRTEMAALDLSGTGHTLGLVKMRLRPGINSTGVIEETSNNTAGTLDLPPFTATGTADSSFDIFFEVEFGGQVYHNVQPLRWLDVIDYKPPKNASYENYDQGTPLFDANGNQTIYSIRHTIYWPGSCGDNLHPIPIGDLNQDCIVNFFDLAIFATHWLECTRDVCP
jgi:hypothetical protein